MKTEFCIIKASFNESPKTLNRLFIIDSKYSLLALGNILCSILNTQFSHYFMFKDKVNEYVAASWLADSLNQETTKDYRDVKIKDVVLDEENKFTFIYDTGEDYIFDLEIQGVVSLDYSKKVCVLEANGKQIFEDNITDFYDFIEGKKVDSSSLWDYEGSLNGFFKPINLNKMNSKIHDDLCEGYVKNGKEQAYLDDFVDKDSLEIINNN